MSGSFKKETPPSRLISGGVSIFFTGQWCAAWTTAGILVTPGAIKVNKIKSQSSPTGTLQITVSGNVLHQKSST